MEIHPIINIGYLRVAELSIIFIFLLKIFLFEGKQKSTFPQKDVDYVSKLIFLVNTVAKNGPLPY